MSRLKFEVSHRAFSLGKEFNPEKPWLPASSHHIPAPGRKEERPGSRRRRCWLAAQRGAEPDGGSGRCASLAAAALARVRAGSWAETGRSPRRTASLPGVSPRLVPRGSGAASAAHLAVGCGRRGAGGSSSAGEDVTLSERQCQVQVKKKRRGVRSKCNPGRNLTPKELRDTARTVNPWDSHPADGRPEAGAGASFPPGPPEVPGRARPRPFFRLLPGEACRPGPGAASGSRAPGWPGTQPGRERADEAAPLPPPGAGGGALRAAHPGAEGGPGPQLPGKGLFSGCPPPPSVRPPLLPSGTACLFRFLSSTLLDSSIPLRHAPTTDPAGELEGSACPGGVAAGPGAASPKGRGPRGRPPRRREQRGRETRGTSRTGRGPRQRPGPASLPICRTKAAEAAELRWRPSTGGKQNQTKRGERKSEMALLKMEPRPLGRLSSSLTSSTFVFLVLQRPPPRLSSP
ncbi:collagen alpha-2(I) chain-like [Kogia breviceps]|uniref:collagen alpha-2(I) chain-like n=1 Tax=Kogia breviceps TaxID=27615 RepID=UPI0034D3850C